MGIPIFLICFLVFIFIFNYKLRTLTVASKKKSDSFWKKEEVAMFTRKQSLEDLDYIQLDIHSLPLLTRKEYKVLDKLDILEIQQKVVDLSKEPLLNLSGISNTDLKLKFGAANLENLIKYEETYHQLIKYLYKWALELHNCNKDTEAIRILEEGINIHTDISDHYILLGKLYYIHNRKDELNQLYEKVKDTTFPLKNKILKNLISHINILD